MNEGMNELPSLFVLHEFNGVVHVLVHSQQKRKLTGEKWLRFLILTSSETRFSSLKEGRAVGCLGLYRVSR